MSPGSFEEFYMRQYQPVLAYARVLTGDRSVAEDVTHEGFAAALVSWSTIDNPEAWIRTVVANRARSRWRRSYNEQRAVTRLHADAMRSDEIPEDTEDFWRVVRTLPVNQARAVALFYLEDLPIRRIAEILGCKESTARGYLSKGRRTLAERLGVDE